MVLIDDSLYGLSEMIENFEAIRSAGFRPEPTELFAGGVIMSRGEAAETMLSEVVEHLSLEAAQRLLTRYLPVPKYALNSAPDLAKRLVRKLGVNWEELLPAAARASKTSSGNKRGASEMLCRLGLIAVGVREIRTRPQSPPAY